MIWQTVSYVGAFVGGIVAALVGVAVLARRKLRQFQASLRPLPKS